MIQGPYIFIVDPSRPSVQVYFVDQIARCGTPDAVPIVTWDVWFPRVKDTKAFLDLIEAENGGFDFHIWASHPGYVYRVIFRPRAPHADKRRCPFQISVEDIVFSSEYESIGIPGSAGLLDPWQMYRVLDLSIPKPYDHYIDIARYVCMDAVLGRLCFVDAKDKSLQLIDFV
ncbi:hypothetical protein PLICRDRAFT_55665 [Plicaturopsis crispa FD-325 SS-3]|nr:hypothetical protein PLICRDRAFT_55665 [Plicaturopsis crispa FD-325 SS-3]